MNFSRKCIILIERQAGPLVKLFYLYLVFVSPASSRSETCMYYFYGVIVGVSVGGINLYSAFRFISLL